MRALPRWCRTAAGLLVVAACLASGCGRRAPELLLVYSGDCQGLIEPCGCISGRLGGLARRATVLEPLLRRYPARLVVDAGGWSAVTQTGDRAARSRLLLAGMHELGLEIANVSVRDLRLGEHALAALTDSTGVQLVSANIDADRTWLRPYVVLSRAVGGREMRIGVTGVSGGGDPGDDWALRPHIDDPIRVARAMLAELESQTDLQVLLAALPVAELDAAIGDLGGYEVLVAGAGDLREAQAIASAPLVLSAGSQCKFAAWTALGWRGGDTIASVAAGVEALDATVPDAPRWARRVAEWQERLGDAAGAAPAPTPP